VLHLKLEPKVSMGMWGKTRAGGLIRGGKTVRGGSTGMADDQDTIFLQTEIGGRLLEWGAVLMRAQRNGRPSAD